MSHVFVKAKEKIRPSLVIDNMHARKVFVVSTTTCYRTQLIYVYVFCTKKKFQADINYRLAQISLITSTFFYEKVTIYDMQMPAFQKNIAIVKTPFCLID